MTHKSILAKSTLDGHTLAAINEFNEESKMTRMEIASPLSHV